MRRRLLVIPVVLGATAACTGSSGSFTNLKSDGTRLVAADRVDAPVLQGKSLDGNGQQLTTADDKGKVVVVNLWGSWCGPCQGEADALTQVAADTADKGVTFLGVDTRDVDGMARSFRAAHHQTYPTIVDTDGSVSAKWRPFPANATPVTVLIDKQGRVAARIVGGVTYSQLSAAVDALAAEA